MDQKKKKKKKGKKSNVKANGYWKFYEICVTREGYGELLVSKSVCELIRQYMGNQLYKVTIARLLIFLHSEF